MFFLCSQIHVLNLSANAQYQIKLLELVASYRGFQVEPQLAYSTGENALCMYGVHACGNVLLCTFCLKALTEPPVNLSHCKIKISLSCCIENTYIAVLKQVVLDSAYA